MNEIVLNDYKEDLLKENYKLIYPNDLGLIVTMEKGDTKLIYKRGFDKRLGFIGAFENRNKLFASYHIFKVVRNLNSNFNGRLKLVFKELNKSEVKEIPIFIIKIIDEQGEEYCNDSWSKRIKELYLSADKEKLVIVVDESFLFPRQLKELQLKQKAEKLENKIESLLK